MTKRTKENLLRRKKLRIRRIVILLVIIIFIILQLKYNLTKEVVLLINPIDISSIQISVPKQDIEVGESLDIKMVINPNNYSKSNLQWHSTNEDIVQIIDNKVVAKTPGNAKIYLTNNEVKSNEININCIISISEVEIENKIEEMQIGDIHKINTKVMPENATNKEIYYESSNTDILTIDNTGNIIANDIGQSTISIKDSKERKLEQFDIKVNKIPVKTLQLDDTQITLGKGQKYIINAKVTPIEATYTDVVWKSSNENIITIKDRIITAIGVGTADIIAVTDNGDKKEVCKVTVTKTNPNNKKKYSNGNYNIRTGSSTDYKVLATTTKYEEIEFLKELSNGWNKVRNSKGVVGYTLVKSNYYLDEKPVEPAPVSDKKPQIDTTVSSYLIKNVPYLNQISLGYPTGCEAVSATMLLKYKGYNVSVQDIIKNTKSGSKKYEENGTWYGANPFEEFVGDPSLGLSKGSYGVFAKPIANAMSKYAGDKVKNISGCTEKELFSYVSKGNPVVVWCVKNGGNLSNGVTWKYIDGSGSFQELVGEHCAVLIGYDEDYVYLNDPSAGANAKQSKTKFISNWKKLYSQAIIVQ